MSYILEALKKSEQERGNGNIPGVQTIHSSSLRYTNERKKIWPYVLVAAVVLNLLALVYLIYINTSSLQQNQAKPTVQTLTSKPSTPVEQQSAEPVQTIVNKQPDIPATSHTSSTETNSTEPATIEEPNARNSYSNKPLVEFNELTDDVRSRLPPINFSAHVYSTNPAQRSVVINDKFLGEGEQVAQGLVINEITPNGVIFEFETYRIRSGVVSNWDI